MKKICFFTLFALFIYSSIFAQNVSLDQAVQNSAGTIESRLPQGAKVAVLVFTSSAQAFSDYILDELATAISASRKIQVIERQHIDAIRRELNIQMSGDVSDIEVRRVGHQLGAQYVVTGSLVDIGNAYRFRVAAIDVETAVREGSSSLNININDPQVVFLLTGQRTTQPVQAPAQSMLQFSRDVPIGIIVDNDIQNQIKDAFTNILRVTGFSIGENNSRYVIRGSLSISDSAIGSNVFVRYELKTNLIDMLTGTVLSPSSYEINGREGHTTFADAQSRAIRAAIRRIDSDYPNILRSILSQNTR